MRFTLKPYQRSAVEHVLDRLDEARTIYHRDGVTSSFSLTATTGAGKTVMAAAAIEALFTGDDELDVEADPKAVVLWFSDDPALNLQTRDRLLEASDRLTSADLRVIEHPFSERRLEAGKVYFLNTGKLTKSSLLTRGHHSDADDESALIQATPDLQATTIWETIANTVRDPDRHLYLILDEAHRGFGGRTSRDKATIVTKLVNGPGDEFPPIPVVWGISATIDRFVDAMKTAEQGQKRRRLAPVIVSPSAVQSSGLVKDTINLAIPDEAGQFDITFVRLAARRLRDSKERWATYAKEQDDPVVVEPLLILQVPNTPDEDEIGFALDAIAEEIPEIVGRNVRHVLGEHKSMKFGRWDVEWIEPQRVEDTTKVRVLVAKDAISTGWDCPRAEVMVSFRPAKDQTHITQLLGRMVRSPLARRVPGDDRLNAVDCILPFFDRTTAGKVAKYITGQIDDLPDRPTKKVLLDGREMRRNPAIPHSVWDLWERLPTQTMPTRKARPVIRLTSLAQALSRDELRPGALKEVREDLAAQLDEFARRYGSALDNAIQEVWDVHVKEIVGKVGGAALSYQDFILRADDRAIRTAFRFAKRALGGEVANAYVHLLAPDDDDEDAVRDAFVQASALAAMKEVRELIDAAANQRSTAWFDEYREQIADLPDERQQEYEEIRGLAVEPERSRLAAPKSRMEDFAVYDEDKLPTPAPLVDLHLMSDEHGKFPIGDLNPWEREVVEAEMSRDGSVAWYRNPPRPALDSLTIPYRDAQGDWRSMHPDFVFFHQVDGEVKASIVDPHGHHLEDAKEKLVTLAEFAERYGPSFHRIEALSKFGSVMRSIPLHLPYAREGIKQTGRSIIEFYHSDLALDYDAQEAR